MSEPEGRRHLMPNSYCVTQASGGFILLYHDLTSASMEGGIWRTLIFKYPPRSRGVFGNFGKSASIEGGIWKILSKHASIDEVFDLNELKPVVGVWCWEWYNSIKPPEA